MAKRTRKPKLCERHFSPAWSVWVCPLCKKEQPKRSDVYVSADDRKFICKECAEKYNEAVQKGNN